MLRYINEYIIVIIIIIIIIIIVVIIIIIIIIIIIVSFIRKSSSHRNIFFLKTRFILKSKMAAVGHLENRGQPIVQEGFVIVTIVGCWTHKWH